MIISVKTFHDWIVAIHESDCYTVMIYDASMKLLTSFVMDYGVDHGHMIAESSYVVTKDGYLVVMDSQNNLSCFSMIASSRWETWKRRWFGHSVLWRTPMDLTPIYPLSRSHSPFAWNMVEIYEPSRIGVAGFYYPIQIFDTMSGDRLLSIPVQSMILVAIQDTFFCREHREGNPRGVYMLRGEDVIYQCQSVEHFESIHHAASHGDLVVTISLSLLEMYYELPLRSQLLWSTKKSFYNISFSGNGRTLLCQSYGENQTWKMQIRLPRTGIILQVLEAGSDCRLSPCGSYLIDIEDGKLITTPVKNIRPLASLLFLQKVSSRLGISLLLKL